MAISALDAISPAFHHTKQQLLHPFRGGQWARLALVGLLAGELTSGSCSSPNFHIPQRPTGSQHLFNIGLPAGNPMLYAGMIAVLVVAALVLMVLFIYVSSVMRFILFDSVITKHCEIGRGWNRRQRPGLLLFVWQILFSLCTFAVLALVIGVPALAAYAAGWFNHGREHMVAWVLGGVALFFVLLLWFVVTAVVHVCTKDFVVPQMALEGLGPVQAWGRLLPMLEMEKGPFAGYLGMKIVLALAAAVVLGVITGVVILLLLIPIGGFGVVAVLIGKTAGLTWNLYTISITVVVGCLVFAILMYLIGFISVPATVFFPAYSIYFFAPRYPALDRLLQSSLPPAHAAVIPPLPAIPDAGGQTL